MSKHVMTLRELKQAGAMGRIQGAAFELLVARGYEATKVTDVAAAAEVSPSSVYRYFGTKEGVFVWDPLEGPFMDLVQRGLETSEPMDAVEAAFHTVVVELEDEAETVLRERTRLIFATPELREAMRAMVLGFGDDLAVVLRAAGTGRLEAGVIAAATAAALMVAVEHWARPGADDTLATVTNDAFRALRVASI